MYDQRKCNELTQPQEESRGKNKFCFCSIEVICFLSTLFAFTLGLILGALLSVVVLAALPAIIVLLVALIIMIISILITRRCYCCPRNKCD